MRKKNKLFLGLVSAATVITIAPIAASCSKDPNTVPIPPHDQEKYKQVINWFNQINLSDLDSSKFPQELTNFKQDEYYRDYLRKWNFGPDDSEPAKKIDKEFIFDPNKGFYKKLAEHNLLEFFNKNFKIRLRTASQNLNILLNFSLIPISEDERVKDLNSQEYFMAKYYAIRNVFLPLGEFNLNVEKSKETTTFDLLSYIIPPVAIALVIIYIVVAIYIRKKRQKRRK
ncbi:Vmc-like lipoprotein signal peptide domain-containing protein [Mycoplasma phocoeninasale]|uniref:Vmc-like lipoprotein signal peptide domain-containing protein n=1 Tax=Mycoplasma phocoeninasale TaxID=2726117 RepID=UPI001968119D|nr:hypothetical protein [Mycoplasma phocoeninasale]MBN0970691.1 hypothetical protein [Mycoplasma phocoeninasale]